MPVTGLAVHASHHQHALQQAMNFLGLSLCGTCHCAGLLCMEVEGVPHFAAAACLLQQCGHHLCQEPGPSAAGQLLGSHHRHCGVNLTE